MASRVHAYFLAGHRSVIFRLFCTGGYAEEETTNSKKTADVRAMAFFRDSWGGLLSTRPFKIFLLHVYLAYLAIAIWGCVNVSQGITLDRLAGDGSYVADYYDQDIKYFREYGPVVSVVIHKEIDTWNKTERDEIDNLLKQFEASEYFHGKDVTSAWTRDFTAFVGGNFVESSNFSFLLNYFLLSYPHHKIDIVRDSSGKVEYSRFFVYSNDTVTSVREGSMMSTAREIADSHLNLNVTVFHPAFIFYDQYLEVWPNTRQNLLIATAAIFVVSLFLIPHPVCSLWVTFRIVSICTGVIGYMTWWGVNLDTISMINIIICIGFCVDFSAHITYAYVSAEGDTGNQRMRNALHAIGYPIAQGALSTILGVFALAFSASYIFRTFFKTMFLVLSLGAFHGLLIIPALLSIMGPPKIKKKLHSVYPMNSPKLPSVVGGVDGWSHRDMGHMEPDRGFGTPLRYANDFQPTSPVRPRRDGSPARYCSVQNNPRNGDCGIGNGLAPMPYQDGELPPRYEESGYQEGWPRENKYVASLNGRGRPQDRYVGPHEYVPPVNDIGRPRDNYIGPHDYRPPMTNMGGPRDIYDGPHDYSPPMTNMGGPQDNYDEPRVYRPPMTNMGGPRDNYDGPHIYMQSMINVGGPRDNYRGPRKYRPRMSDMGSPQYRPGSPGGHQMANSWSRY